MPSFVLDDHPRFIAFLQKYYEFMEQEGEPIEFIGNLPDYGDIDKTVTSFIKFFQQQFALQIPENILVDKNWLFKNIREFYRTRGSENSFRFLFRVLFDDRIGFRFPGDEILRASDGRWEQESFLKTLWTPQVAALQGRKIRGQVSNATGILEKVINTTEGGGIIAEIEIDSIDGIFEIGETVTGTDANGNVINFLLKTMLADIIITNPGNNYAVGNPVAFLPPTTGSLTLSAQVKELTKGTVTGATVNNGGAGFVVGEYLNLDNFLVLDQFGRTARIRVLQETAGVIDSVVIENVGFGYTGLPILDGDGNAGGTGADITITGTNIGGVRKINILQPGYDIDVPPNIDLSGSGDGTATAITTIKAVILEDVGRFITTDSLLDSNRVLQDNDFFQDYSYVIKSSTAFGEWEEVVKKILHPAGTKLFPQISTDLSVPAPVLDILMSIAQADLDFILFPPGAGSDKELNMTALVFAVLTIPLLAEPIDSSRQLNNTWGWFERTMFAHAGFSPTPWGTSDSAGYPVSLFESFMSVDFLAANQYTETRYIPMSDVEEPNVVEDFESASSPNTAFWNSVSTGTNSTDQSKFGTKSRKFSGFEFLREAAGITPNDIRQLRFYFYASSTGSDGGTDKTRIAALYENASGEGAAVYLSNSGGNLFIGASDGITTSVNDLMISQDTWYKIVFTVEDNTFELKVDNAIVSSGTATDADAMDRFEIGNVTDQAANFISYFDQVRAYDRLLITSQP